MDASTSKKNLNQGDRSQVFSLSVTELLFLMVFVAMAFAFFADAEGKTELTSAQNDVKELKEQLRKEKESGERQNAKIADLKGQVEILTDFVGNLLGDESVTLGEMGFGKSVDQRNHFRKDLEKRYKKHLKRLGCGTGYPRCKVTNSTLLSLYLREDGALDVSARWNEDAREAITQVPGLMQLVTKRTVTMEEFSRHAEQIFQWGDSQDVACRFHVDASSMAPNLSAGFVSERMRIIDKYFYPKRY
jgi:cell division protein FtsL